MRPRSRPRDRKRQIEQAAALAFARNGYHAVGMQDIAAAVGISAPALYRHFPNKYALFVRTAMTLAHRLNEATDHAASLPLDSADDGRQMLDALLSAVITTTIDLRATGGIYRWEGRYLDKPDREALTAEFALLRRRFEAPHRRCHPAVPEDDRRVQVLAALSVVASITAHRAVVGVRALTGLLRDAAWRVLDGDVVLDEAVWEPPAPSVRAAESRRDRLVESAVRQFAARGYNEVTIEELAAEADLTPSGVYRHFDGKPALLLAACDRAAAELERSLLQARESASSPRQALQRLCRVYIAHSFSHLALMRVYFAELGNLPPDDQRRIRALQRAHVAEWVALLRTERPELAEREAAVLVHAGLGVVTDHVPLARSSDSAAQRRLTRMVEMVLGVA